MVLQMQFIIFPPPKWPILCQVGR